MFTDSGSYRYSPGVHDVTCVMNEDAVVLQEAA